MPMKRNVLKLVKDPSNTDNPELIPYITPGFIPFSLVYESLEVLEELDNPDNKKSSKEQMDTVMDLVVRIYGNQFKRDDLLQRLHSPDAMNTLKAQIQFVAQGVQDDETKNFLESMK